MWALTIYNAGTIVGSVIIDSFESCYSIGILLMQHLDTATHFSCALPL